MNGYIPDYYDDDEFKTHPENFNMMPPFPFGTFQTMSFELPQKEAEPDPPAWFFAVFYLFVSFCGYIFINHFYSIPYPVVLCGLLFLKFLLFTIRKSDYDELWAIAKPKKKTK